MTDILLKGGSATPSFLHNINLVGLFAGEFDVDAILERTHILLILIQR
jgi:hypothetical protein